MMPTQTDVDGVERMSTMGLLVANAAQRFGLNPKEAKRFVKFAVVGTFGAIVDFGAYNLLLGPLGRSSLAVGLNGALPGGWGLSAEQATAMVAGTISFIMAIISNFIWNRYWTYPDSRTKSVRRQFAQFFVVNVSAIAVRLPVLGLTVPFFTNLSAQLLTGVGDSLTVRLGKNLALALAVGIAMFWNFFVNRYWTYGDVES